MLVSIMSRFVLPDFRGTLIHNQPRRLLLKFNTTTLGRFDDRIEFIFRDETLSQQFVIARPILGTIANRAELEALGPIAPYVRPARRRFHDQEGHDDIPGPRYEFESDVIWVAKLAPFNVPQKIKDILSVGSTNQQIDSIRTMALPPVFDATSYSRHWDTLLYVEELKMM